MRPGQRGTRRGRWWEALACGAVLALAAALRFFRLDAQSLWFDEGISAYHLQRSFMEVVQATAGDTHPPLYYWTLKLWAGVFGSSELGLRSLSAVCGVGVVGLTWLLGRRLFGPWPATLGALLLALSPLAVYYSQEVRMYTLVGLLALLAVHLALRWLSPEFRVLSAESRAPQLETQHSALSTQHSALVLYVLVAAATLYTQYLGASVLAALNLSVLGALVRQPRRAATWLVAQGAVALLFLPWLPVLLDQSQHRTLNTSPRTLPNLLLQTATALTLG
ncbi:MAG: glycosyltransferase family 39 protein, partial [Chloroflexi bacterium]|nr:glycosyltransferase family 39 protein [Chloroflexota bacterium]